MFSTSFLVIWYRISFIFVPFTVRVSESIEVPGFFDGMLISLSVGARG